MPDTPDLFEHLREPLEAEAARLGRIWEEESVEPVEDFAAVLADAVLALLRSHTEQVGWQLSEGGGLHDDTWVPHFEHDLCVPVFRFSSGEEA